MEVSVQCLQHHRLDSDDNDSHVHNGPEQLPHALASRMDCHVRCLDQLHHVPQTVSDNRLPLSLITRTTKSSARHLWAVLSSCSADVTTSHRTTLLTETLNTVVNYQL